MIQSTLGISSPRAATSVQSRIPVGALQNSKKVFVRFCCFCFPYPSALVLKSFQREGDLHVDQEQGRRCNSATRRGI